MCQLQGEGKKCLASSGIRGQGPSTVVGVCVSLFHCLMQHPQGEARNPYLETMELRREINLAGKRTCNAHHSRVLSFGLFLHTEGQAGLRAYVLVHMTLPRELNLGIGLREMCFGCTATVAICFYQVFNIRPSRMPKDTRRRFRGNPMEWSMSWDLWKRRAMFHAIDAEGRSMPRRYKKIPIC